MTSPSLIEKNYQEIKKKITAAETAGDFMAGSTTLIAVSKGQPVESIEFLYGLGHRDFGENYAQEFLEKAATLETRGCADIRWHFIGHLQTKKVKPVLNVAQFIHSVDSEKLLLEIARRQVERRVATRMQIFIEVNLGQEPNKTGATSEAAPKLTALAATFPEIRVCGLMCVPEAAITGEKLAARFDELRELEKNCRPATERMLSMGMSGDFELAIAHGATHVRVGTALFGPR